jgi:hypothetical protein
MKNEYLAAALLAIAAVAITFGTNSPGSNCRSPSPASVEALFAPCSYSKQAAQIALRPEEEPIAATVLAAR